DGALAGLASAGPVLHGQVLHRQPHPRTLLATLRPVAGRSRRLPSWRGEGPEGAPGHPARRRVLRTASAGRTNLCLGGLPDPTARTADRAEQATHQAAAGLLSGPTEAVAPR